MHTESNSNVSAFLAKLWNMVEDPATDHLISWSPTGRSFLIRNQAMFTSELISKYYKHSNMASFIRQLNMYGFHKMPSVELGGLKCDKDEIEFAHTFFVKDQPHLMDNIKRKVTSNKSQDSVQSSFKPEVMGKVVSEIKSLKVRQEDMDTVLNDMRAENATLWGELAVMRQKYIKQQRMVNKLIQFLVTTLVQPSRNGLSVKRRYPLMLSDLSRSHKRSKLSKDVEKDLQDPTGPVIHEVMDSIDNLSYTDLYENVTPTVQSPQEHSEILTDDENVNGVYPDIVENSETETKKKHVYKGKKRRRNDVPIKISIPSENEQKRREDMHLLQLSTDEEEPVTFLRNESICSKPVPTATVRSSKLAAMAANIKSRDVDSVDVDSADVDPTDVEDNVEALHNDASRLQEILIIPEILNDSNIQDIQNKEDNNEMNKRLNQMDHGRSVLVTNNNEQCNGNRLTESLVTEDNCYDSGGARSVNCVSSPGKTNVNYREEFSNHMDTTETDLDNLCGILRGQNSYSIDTNALLGLFDTDDPMTFALPIHPELNPNYEREEDNMISDSTNGCAGGELMTYNPPSTLFDDEMFLENASSLLSNPSDLQTNNLYTLDAEDLKVEPF